jgi:biopolymer transport protein ExbB/TolQ
LKGEGSLATLMTMIHPLHATFVGSSFLLNNGITFSLLCGALGIVVAILLIAYVLRSDKGTEKMRESAGAVQEGPKA